MSSSTRPINENPGRARVWFPLAAFVVLTVYQALHHEMWRDEVRALSVATEAATWGKMFGDLHQEGHPGLWYVILRIAYGLTNSNLVLPALALAIAWIAAFLILRYAPFPFWLRLLSVFGAFLGYEYSVMARNYGLGVMLLIVACVLFASRDRRPIPLAIVLALMANTSVHAALASVVIVFLWALDFFDRDRRREILGAQSVAGFVIAIGGAALAILSARPSADMSYATSLHHFGIGNVLSSILIDPGKGLKGVYVADIAASGELPLIRLGIDPSIASRVIVDIALLAVAWALAPSRKHLVALIVAILSFEVFFQGIYPAAIRHQGVVTFLIFGICWIAVREMKSDDTAFGKRVAFGLLPMMLIQTIALPIVARRHLMHPATSSKAFASVINATPRLSNAILVSEPDYLMEPLPYYVPNRVYMPRQHEFHYRVYFDAGAHRQHDLSLGGLIDAADSVGCANRSPVLISIGYPNFRKLPSGVAHGVFHGADFTWSVEEKTRLSTRARLLGDFDDATTDENYQVFELPPLDPAACSPRP